MCICIQYGIQNSTTVGSVSPLQPFIIKYNFNNNTLKYDIESHGGLLLLSTETS